MQQNIVDRAKTYLVRHRYRRVFRKIVQVLGCLVVFVTTYALILPAITMENTVYCGLEEHTHSEACYHQSVQKNLICSSAHLNLHTHSDGCYGEAGALICGQADYLAHVHAEHCYDKEGNLICSIPQRSAHVHTEDCYVPGETQPVVLHVHSESCKEVHKGDLICTIEEYEGHVHQDSCYVPGQNLLCTVVENHVHSDGCYDQPLNCNLSTDPHIHSEGCYGKGDLCCSENSDDHTHSDDCYASILICGKQEGDAHSHETGCYGQPILVCKIPENHQHENSCYEAVLNCGQEEDPGHSHSDACWQWNTVLICGLEEEEPEPTEPAEPVLICTEPIAQTHIHGDSCFEESNITAEPVCGISDEGHTHSAACYILDCGMQEHTHTKSCYSNPDADVESRATWEASMKDVELTGDWNLDVVAIAKSQLGYMESTRNYAVWEDDSTHGYTRYGAWYGSFYGDWCGMFASFCLTYGGVEDVPLNYGVRPWIEDLSKPELDLYRLAEEYTPIPGDLVFFDWEDDGLSDHVGIVYEVLEASENEKAKLKTIEGNSNNCVQFVTYDLDSPVLLGYGMLPENPDAEYTCGYWKHVHNKRDCYDEEDNLICHQNEHVHCEDCLTEQIEEPELFCGMEIHIHEASCYDENGGLICELDEHEHSESCMTAPEPEPVYYCGLEIHTHEATCYNETEELICGHDEHTHSDDCLIKPTVYYCGLEIHIHETSCYDENGGLICELDEHEHSESCMTAPEPEPVFYCGLEVHAHSESCLDETGKLACMQDEHEHNESCLIQYYCGKVVHIHDEAVCFDADGILICEKQVHEHLASCLTEPKLYCGREEHTHCDECYDENNILICEVPEHTHDERCWQPMMMATAPKVAYFCNQQEHIHDDSCRDETGNLICGISEHTHVSMCLADLSDLSADEQTQVASLIRLIDEIPSADEIEEKLLEFEDEEARERWEMKAYQEIALAYSRYSNLTEALQERVVNREKLLELEPIWSRITLAEHVIWIDGTNGGMTSLTGATNKAYTYEFGDTFTLPSAADQERQNNDPQKLNGPSKYSYTIRGWYDIYNKQYYKAGATVTVTRDTVFYADWMAATYDIGINKNTVTTVSTNDFITTHVFDYGSIFNMYSVEMEEQETTLSANSHHEEWNIIPKSAETGSHGIILRDWDSDGLRFISRPLNYEEEPHTHNTTTSDYDIIPDLYGEYNMYNLFFNPNTSYLGKDYLGTGDHLFQYDSSTGYYFYNSADNAAAFNMSEQRFYVYNYLERTTISDSNSADFLPFNSPDTNNPSGYSPQSTTSSGKTRYRYDALKENANRTGTNFWFGMTMEIEFFLPDKPNPNNPNANKSTHGEQMIFEFSGDDDVFVLIDGVKEENLVLDIGGLHTKKSGSINFSTGTAIVDGENSVAGTNILRNLSPGKHKLILCYMERGSSMSNCSIRFNLSPRYTLSVEKEDLLTGDLLDGATFAVYTDEACTTPALLWESYEAYQNNKPSIHSFEVKDGTGSIWGLVPDNVYYLKETKTPGEMYALPDGAVRLQMSMTGKAQVDVINNTTSGFTVQSSSQNNETLMINLNISNSIGTGNKEVQVRKVWRDPQATPVKVFLLANGQRIREETLSSENNWEYRWTNLPETRINPDTKREEEIVYTVQEGTISGFSSQVAPMNPVTTVTWTQLGNNAWFTQGQTYLLSSTAGYLATTSDGDLTWITDMETAKATSSAWWTVGTISGNSVQLKNETGPNGEGYYLRYDNSTWENLCFYASSVGGSVTFNSHKFSFTYSNRVRYMTSQVDAGKIMVSNSSGDGLTFTLHQRVVENADNSYNGVGYYIINTAIPPEEQTSLRVTKRWTDRDGTTDFADVSVYENLTVSVALLANGKETGQTANLARRNDWRHTFTGLPVQNAQGEKIIYSVVESKSFDDWTARYTDVTEDEYGNFSVGINNVYSRKIDIPVEKRWDAGLRGLETDVEILLYSAPDDNQAATLVDSITLTAESDWKGVFKAVPPEIDGINYYIYEASGKFNPIYGEPARVFINNTAQRVSRVVFDSETKEANITTVTNRPPVELPETGGTGIIPYTAGGMLFVAAAMILLYENYSKRRKGATQTP